MSKELIINASLPELRIALLESGTIQDLHIERDSNKGIVGNIYKGRVNRVLPGMQAAFVDIGLDKAAFLYVDDVFVHAHVMGEDTEVEEVVQESAGELTNDFAEEQMQALEESYEGSSSDDAADEDLADEQLAAEMSDQDHKGESVDEQAAFESASVDAEESPDEMLAESAGQGQESSDEEADEEVELEASGESEADEEADVDTSEDEDSGASEETASLGGLVQEDGGGNGRKRRSRGRRGGRKHRFPKGSEEGQELADGGDSDELPGAMRETLGDQGSVSSDRSSLEGGELSGTQRKTTGKQSPEFKEQRGKDRKIRGRLPQRAQANIGDLLQEGQEVIVQVAKDPIAQKGARLTCHVSLPGRHLVCMPTIDHIGVSRRIERDDERRRLRDFVQRNRFNRMGFIVRTASSGKDTEMLIRQDMEYLAKLWSGIREKADESPAPALLYEDLNVVLRSIRDWVNQDIDRVVVDSRFHYNELQQFAERFMPDLSPKIELYQGDIPIFDAYGISSELHRSLERKVWLKSGGSIVIDQAEALVAIDVNTGRYVGKRNLEDTILKTNLEAAEEIAYQLRVRNCGGIIIVDFIDMEKDENRMRVYRALDEALKRDRARPTIQKISDLGLVEMTRKRTRDTVIRTLCEPCAQCEGKGFMKTKMTVAYEILREVERLGVERDSKKILVSAHADVVDFLAIELRETLDQIERRYQKTIYLQSLPSIHSEQYEVVSDRSQSKKFQQQDIARVLRVERDKQDRQEKRDRSGGRGRGGQKQKNREPVRDRDEEGVSAGVQTAKPNEPVREKFVIRPRQPVAQTAAVANEALGNEVVDGNQSPDTLDPRPRSPQSISPQSQRVTGSVSPGSDEHPDEDQLAYLRAQAAQDAAIQGLASGNSGNNRSNNYRKNSGGAGSNGGGRFQRHARKSGGRGGRGPQNDNIGNSSGGGGNNRNRFRGQRDHGQSQGNVPSLGMQGLPRDYGSED
jgi:ribonuclease G